MQKKHFFAVFVWTMTFAILFMAIVLWKLHETRQEQGERPHYETSNLTIIRGDGTIFPFGVEVARTSQEQAYGLMFVTSLDQDKGMIFPYSPPQITAFWMKNTLIPLDMLFIRPDNTIGRIVSEAIPKDLTPIPSQDPVVAVIEIKGGVAKQDGLSVGDKVVSPILAAPQE